MTEPFRNRQRSFSPGAVVELFELDFSKLNGNPIGTESDIRRFVADAQLDLTAVTLGGVVFDPLPIRIRGNDKTSEGKPPRPILEVANTANLISSLIESLDDLIGALVTLRRIFAEHLDEGPDPDPTAEWPKEVYRVEQKRVENRLFVEFLLAAKFDLQDVKIPRRIIEATRCPWTYQGLECAWVPGAGPYFDLENQSTTVGADNCARDYTACKLRFGSRGEPLRIGAFPSASRPVR